MRASLAIALGLSLAACGGDQTASEQTGGEVSANVISAQGNDVTAIDAATGADANMAADVEYNLTDLNESGADTDEAGANAG